MFLLEYCSFINSLTNLHVSILANTPSLLFIHSFIHQFLAQQRVCVRGFLCVNKLPSFFCPVGKSDTGLFLPVLCAIIPPALSTTSTACVCLEIHASPSDFKQGCTTHFEIIGSSLSFTGLSVEHSSFQLDMTAAQHELLLIFIKPSLHFTHVSG